jgi:two-component system, LuxR family, sensor kinase FixL
MINLHTKQKETGTTTTVREGRRQKLERTTHDLAERVKELNCLYLISSMVEEQAISLEEILQGTVDVLPPAWQYPEITCSRILLGDRAFVTANFEETSWRQSQPILVGGAQVGLLQICYLEERPQKDEGPFLKEERSLIKVIAERIGGIIERKQAETALRESEARNTALLNAIPDFMFQLDSDGNLVGFHEGRFTEHHAFFARLLGKNISLLSTEKRLLPHRLVEQIMMYVKRAFTTGKTQVFEQHLPLNGAMTDFEIRIAVSRPTEVLGIVRDVTFRKRLEREILEISGREQRRIGQDLHDSLCQHLAGIGFMAKVLERKIAGGTPVDAAQPAEIVRLIDDAITLTRGFARGLNPIMLESDGLMLALVELAGNTQKLFGVTCQFLCKKPFLIDDESVASHLYRIVQEATNNAIKHGKANSVTIEFRADEKANILSITDDGVGIRNVPSPGKGMGLSIMNYRASMIGASIDIRAAEGGGTVVSCSFPEKER